MAQYEGIQLEITGKDRDTMKNYIQSSHDILVSALYNIDPLLDQMIASHLLTHENYCEIRTEKIPPQKARKLLEIVQLQMSDSDVWKFVECLKKCKHHYPRLKNWLAEDIGKFSNVANKTPFFISVEQHTLKSIEGIKRGSTEQKLQKQASILCQRLGHLITPIAMKLFSNETISQYELDIVQGETTLYCQAQRLINICLQKGERSCQKLYEALHDEDTVLAEDIDDTEQPASLSFHNSTPQEETQPAFSLLEDLRLKCGFGEEIHLQQVHKELIREAITLLQLDTGRVMSLNICEFGVLLGLPRKDVQECLFELENAEDVHQLAAVIHTFVEKTNNTERLRQKMASVNLNRLQLSWRAHLLLELLQSGLADCHCCEDVMPQLSNICLFIVRDCLAEREADASEVPTLDIMGCLQKLERNRCADMMIFRELAELWSEGSSENFQKCVPLIAQLVKDTFPHVDTMEFDTVLIRKGVYQCHPRSLKRVASFKGLPVRIIQKVIQPKTMMSFLSEEITSFGNQELMDEEYAQLCLKTLNILQRVQDYQSNKLPTKCNRQLDKKEVAIEIRRLLTAEDFRWNSFDSGMRARLLSLVDFEPLSCKRLLFLKLHYDTFLSLAAYLKSNERQYFQFVFEEVHMYQCNVEMRGVRSVRDPVTIDGGMEEVFQFSTSDRASFLVQVHCRGYVDGQYFMCNQPLLYKLSNVSSNLQEETKKVGTIIAKQAGTTWVRENPDGGLKEIAERITQSSIGNVEMGSCCFLINSWGVDCGIRILYKDDKIFATAEWNADVC
ncbi:uncharacterized protein LOC129702758 [Leucoraja erinacea]|uniref:uncharacterized protein LOC129702758 n=1 Tax=Leucoraja erinaceus TaxID=7782 RepID=UPI002458359B|nr:uncharacterized protein LOC129702758 [Leucoraja erinacea]